MCEDSKGLALPILRSRGERPTAPSYDPTHNPTTHSPTRSPTTHNPTHWDRRRAACGHMNEASATAGGVSAYSRPEHATRGDGLRDGPDGPGGAGWGGVGRGIWSEVEHRVEGRGGGGRAGHLPRYGAARGSGHGAHAPEHGTAQLALVEGVGQPQHGRAPHPCAPHPERRGCRGEESARSPQLSPQSRPQMSAHLASQSSSQSSAPKIRCPTGSTHKLVRFADEEHRGEHHGEHRGGHRGGRRDDGDAARGNAHTRGA